MYSANQNLLYSDFQNLCYKRLESFNSDFQNLCTVTIRISAQRLSESFYSAYQNLCTGTIRKILKQVHAGPTFTLYGGEGVVGRCQKAYIASQIFCSHFFKIAHTSTSGAGRLSSTLRAAVLQLYVDLLSVNPNYLSTASDLHFLPACKVYETSKSMLMINLFDNVARTSAKN